MFLVATVSLCSRAVAAMRLSLIGIPGFNAMIGLFHIEACRDDSGRRQLWSGLIPSPTTGSIFLINSLVLMPEQCFFYISLVSEGCVTVDIGDHAARSGSGSGPMASVFFFRWSTC